MGVHSTAYVGECTRVMDSGQEVVISRCFIEVEHSQRQRRFNIMAAQSLPNETQVPKSGIVGIEMLKMYQMLGEKKLERHQARYGMESSNKRLHIRRTCSAPPIVLIPAQVVGGRVGPKQSPFEVAQSML